MAWWILCFIVAVITVFSKWYFADAVARFRQMLSRQQRETLELKGLLQDERLVHQDLLKQIKSKEADIARLKKRATELRLELHSKQQQAKSPEA